MGSLPLKDGSKLPRASHSLLFDYVVSSVIPCFRYRWTMVLAGIVTLGLGLRHSWTGVALLLD